MALNIKGNILSSNDITSVGVFKSKINRDGLVLYLDAGSLDSYPRTGTAWTDLTGTGNNATLTGGPTFDSGNGGSIYLAGDGSGNSIIAGNSGMIHRTANFTYCAWINQTVLESYDTLFENGLYTGGILLRPSYGTNFEVYSQGSYAGSFSYVPTINIWYYVSIVRYDNLLYFYVNGVYSQQMAFNYDVQPSTAYLWIGASQHSSGQVFKGKISIAQVYNRALHPWEVAENFQATRGRFGI
jgi:hypothetical protein